jgi:hypothetical protein
LTHACVWLTLTTIMCGTVQQAFLTAICTSRMLPRQAATTPSNIARQRHHCRHRASMLSRRLSPIPTQGFPQRLMRGTRRWHHLRSIGQELTVAIRPASRTKSRLSLATMNTTSTTQVKCPPLDVPQQLQRPCQQTSHLYPRGRTTRTVLLLVRKKSTQCLRRALLQQQQLLLLPPPLGLKKKRTRSSSGLKSTLCPCTRTTEISTMSVRSPPGRNRGALEFSYRTRSTKSRWSWEAPSTTTA